MATSAAPDPDRLRRAAGAAADRTERRRARRTTRSRMPACRPGPTCSSSTAAGASSRRARDARGARHRRQVPLIGVAKGADRDAGREPFFIRGARALLAAAARSGALFRPAAARRGAPLRHRLAPGPAQEGHRRRTRSTRSAASARRASARSCTISARQRRSRGPRSSDLRAVAGISDEHGTGDLRPFPRARLTRLTVISSAGYATVDAGRPARLD